MRYVLLLASLLLTSCGITFNHTPPPSQPAASQTFSASFDQVWSGAVSWFAANNVTVEKIQKESGLITAKRDVALAEGFVDIGELTASGPCHGLEVQQCWVTFNVFVAPAGSSRTNVTVNMFGRFKAVAYKGWVSDIEPHYFEGPCNSKGLFEAAIFAHIAKQLGG